ncbi:unnamed protein product [Parajaminaea phylloscopi]
MPADAPEPAPQSGPPPSTPAKRKDPPASVTPVVSARASDEAPVVVQDSSATTLPPTASSAEHTAADDGGDDDDDEELTDIDALSDVSMTTPPPPPSRPRSPTPHKKVRTSAASPPSDAELVSLKASRFVLKQKSKTYTNGMPTMTAIVHFHAHCAGSSHPLDSVASAHLPLVARFAQECDKPVAEVAKLIKRAVFPTENESQQSAGSGEGSDKLPLAVLEAAIEAVAERVNYGLEPSDVASSSSASGSNTIPPRLQIWRWEVRDMDLIQQERQQEVTARREERRRARQQAIQLFNALPLDERSVLLEGKKKGSRPPKAAQGNAATPVRARKRAVSPSAKPASEPQPGDTACSKGTSKAERSAGSAVIVIDDDDEVTADARSSARKDESTRDEGSPSGTKSDQTDGQKDKTKKAVKKKEDDLTAEQRAEKERKNREKDDKRRLKEEKEAKKQKAAELQKKSASMMFGFFGRASPTKDTAETSAAPTVPRQTDYERAFAPIAYKDIAPINRFSRSIDTATLDRALAEETPLPTSQDLLMNVAPSAQRRLQARPSHRRRRPSRSAGLSVREIMRLVAESDLMTGSDIEEQTRQALASLQDRKKVPVKLLQFATDLRPGWFGTWTRPSTIISGRRPLRQDPVALDYNYDSDAEWVDGEDDAKGEEVGDEDDGEDAASVSSGGSEMDDWLVDDLEEVEGGEADIDGDADADGDMLMDDVDPFGVPLSPDVHRRAAPAPKHSSSNAGRKIPLPGRGKNLDKGSKKKAKKVIKNARRFTQKLVPVVLGPCWEETLSVPTHATFAGYQMEFLNDAYPGLDPFTFAGEVPQEAVPPTRDAPSAVVSVGEPSTNQTRGPLDALLAPASGLACVASAAASDGADAAPASAPIPLEVLDAVLRTIEGSTDNKPVLVDVLFKDFKDVKGVNKKKLTQTVDLVALREGRKVDSPWRVKPEWRAKAGIDTLR